MTFELEIQYAEYHPDQVDKVGHVDLEQVLEIIHSFQWDKELENIEDRSMRNLTSTIPSVSIRNPKNELLIISAREKDSFIIEFLNSSHQGELSIPHNSFDNKLNFSTDDVIRHFFNGTASDVFKLRAITSTVPDDTETFKLREYPLFITGLIATILILILILDFWSNGLTYKALPAIMFVGLILFILGLSSIVTLQYILNDWGKEISFEQDGVLTIKQKRTERRIKKDDIKQITIVGNNNHKALRLYKYARIKTKDEQTFIVTSFIIEPIELIKRLKVNHKEESVFLPTINLNITSEKEKQKIKKDKEKKKIEFLENFKSYENDKLRQIANDKKNYADYAIEAAKELLERRK